jgi:hypothetical protein
VSKLHQWRAPTERFAVAHEAALRKLKELAANTSNELYIVHLPIFAIAARINCADDAMLNVEPLTAS